MLATLFDHGAVCEIVLVLYTHVREKHMVTVEGRKIGKTYDGTLNSSREDIRWRLQHHFTLLQFSAADSGPVFTRIDAQTCTIVFFVFFFLLLCHGQQHLMPSLELGVNGGSLCGISFILPSFAFCLVKMFGSILKYFSSSAPSGRELTSSTSLPVLMFTTQASDPSLWQ